MPDSPGIPRSVQQDMLVAPFNDAATTAQSSLYAQTVAGQQASTDGPA